MSSWIPSLFHPNHSRDADSDYDNPTTHTSSSPSRTSRAAASGVKDDLSAVFRGVASFLAPREVNSSSAVSSSASSDAIAGIKNDLGEIQGSFRSGLSFISSKLTSNFLQFQGQLDDDVDEVEDEDGDGDGDGDENAVEVQKKWWILLSEEDLTHLSAPQVVEARETLLKKLQNKSNTMQETSKKHSGNPKTNHEIDKGHILEIDIRGMQHKSTTSEIETANKPMDNMAPEHNISEEERGSCTCVDARKQSENEDISFSDLEDDDDDL